MGKFKKGISVFLATFLLVSSLSVSVGGNGSTTKEKGLLYENTQGIMSMEFGTTFVEPDSNLVHIGNRIPTIKDIPGSVLIVLMT
ncbi:hypothetical protein [Paenibacillus sp. OK060]|uniref:hypothetical protein n=1 Tax=Paenibacillus sp. OK060 TaxID=1881034 RepID=UPI000B80C599|nr:hypothetical protein [Paenibacillus sp. OK060]